MNRRHIYWCHLKACKFIFQTRPFLSNSVLSFSQSNCWKSEILNESVKIDFWVICERFGRPPKKSGFKICPIPPNQAQKPPLGSHHIVGSARPSLPSPKIFISKENFEFHLLRVKWGWCRGCWMDRLRRRVAHKNIKSLGQTELKRGGRRHLQHAGFFSC